MAELNRQLKPRFQLRIRCNHQVNRGIGRNRSRPFHVQVSFHWIIIAQSGIVPIDDDLGGIDWQAEERAELVDQVDVDIGIVNDRDGLSAAGHGRAGGVQRIQVVLDREVLRRQHKVDVARCCP